MSKFSERVATLRLGMNLSLRQLSKLTGISPSAIHSYEVGTREAGYQSLEALADVFNCDIEYLTGKTDVKNSTAAALGYSSLSEFYKEASMADNIRALRIKNNMTMEELGNIVGVQKSAIRKYESGMVENIPRSSIKKMADAFGVSPSFLMGWTEEEKIPSAAEPKLNEGEEALLNLFRLIPEDKKKMVLEMIRAALGTKG